MLVVASVGVALLLASIGYLPTVRFYGQAGIGGMLLGLAVSTAATICGLIPGLNASHAKPIDRHNAIMMGMLVRLVVVVLFGAAAALSDLVPYRPLLIWIAIGYMALLLIDTLAINNLFGKTNPTAKAPEKPTGEIRAL